MQPGLRLVLESHEWGPNSIGPLLENWAGNLLETNHTDDLWRYSVTSKHPEDDDIVQYTSVQVRNVPIVSSNGLTTVLIEVGLMLEQEEDPDLASPGLPEFHRLLPQRFIWDIVSMGGWNRNGVPLTGKSTKVEFDDVEEWWEDLCNEADQIPQIVVGSALSGELPVVRPDTVSAVLSGFANVYHASSLATMEKMTEVMGSMKAPKGSVRLLLTNPSNNPKQPLYIGDRLRGPVVLIDDKEVRRPFEVDIYLRLAKKTLFDENLPEIWEGTAQVPTQSGFEYFLQQREKERFEAIRAIDNLALKNEELEKALEIVEDAYQNTSEENVSLKQEIEERRQDIQALRGELDLSKREIEEKNDIEEGYKSKIREQKKRIKSLKNDLLEANDSVKDLLPVLKKYSQSEGLTDISSLTKSLEDRLFEEEEEEEEEITGFDSVVSVLRHVREEMEDKFLIGQTAMDSAEESVFRHPRRVVEAFETMANSYEYVLNRAKSKQSLDYAQVFRKYGDTVFEVANSESKATMKRHGNSRKFYVDGKLYTMQPHIKIGKNMSPDKCLRIHFQFDHEKEKFVIGHCGSHLPIAKS